MSDQPLEPHLTKISRGERFFRNLYALALVAVVFVVLGTAADVWRLHHGIEDPWGMVFMIALAVLSRVLPYVLVALAFRHLENLFKAVHGALDDLRTTV